MPRIDASRPYLAASASPPCRKGAAASGASVAGKGSDVSGRKDGPPPYPLVWSGEEPAVYLSAVALGGHVVLCAGEETVGAWLVRQFREHAFRRNRGVFFLPAAEIEDLACPANARVLQIHGVGRGRQYNLLSQLTPLEASRLLAAVLPPAESAEVSRRQREAAIFMLHLVFKCLWAVGERFSLARVARILTANSALRELAAQAANAGYPGLSKYLSALTSDPAGLLRVQAPGLASRLELLANHLHYRQWFHAQGEPVAVNLRAGLSAVCLGPDRPGPGVLELRRVWLELVELLMSRTRCTGQAVAFVCGCPWLDRQSAIDWPGLLEDNLDSGNVFLLGASHRSCEGSPAFCSQLASAARTRVETTDGGEGWSICGRPGLY